MSASIRALAAATALFLVPALGPVPPSAASSHPVFDRHRTLVAGLPFRNAEPSVATDPTNSNRVYFMNNVGFPTTWTWRTDNFGLTDPIPVVASLAGSVDVDVAVGSDGVAYLTTITETRVLDSGTLSAPKSVGGDREWVVAGGAPGTAHLIWTDPLFRGIYTPVRWDGSTITYGTAEVATPFQLVTRAGSIARGPGDSLFFAYHTLAGTVNVARRVKVADGPPPQYAWVQYVVGPAAYAQSFPITGVDANGRVYVTWSDGGIVYLAVSEDPVPGQTPDDGLAFTVRADVLEAGHSGTFSTLAVMPSGAIAVAYYDTEQLTNSAVAGPATPWTVRVATNSQPWVSGSTWTHAQVSEGIVHRGSISSRPTRPCGDPLFSYRLADDFEIALTSDGRIVAAYVKDSDTDPCEVDAVASFQTGGPQLS